MRKKIGAAAAVFWAAFAVGLPIAFENIYNWVGYVIMAGGIVLASLILRPEVQMALFKILPGLKNIRFLGGDYKVDGEMVESPDTENLVIKGIGVANVRGDESSIVKMAGRTTAEISDVNSEGYNTIVDMKDDAKAKISNVRAKRHGQIDGDKQSD